MTSRSFDSQEEIERELRSAFDFLDANSDNKIDCDDLAQSLSQLTKQDLIDPARPEEVLTPCITVCQ